MQDQAPKRQTCGRLGVLLAMLHWSKLHQFWGSQIDLSENKVPQMVYRVRYLIARNGWYTSFSDMLTCLKSPKIAFSMNAMRLCWSPRDGRGERESTWKYHAWSRVKFPSLFCTLKISLHSIFQCQKKIIRHWFSVPLLSGHLGVCPIFRQGAPKMVKLWPSGHVHGALQIGGTWEGNLQSPVAWRWDVEAVTTWQPPNRYGT